MAVTEQSRLAMALRYQSANCRCFSITETVMSYVKELSMRKQLVNRLICSVSINSRSYQYLESVQNVMSFA